MSAAFYPMQVVPWDLNCRLLWCMSRVLTTKQLWGNVFVQVIYVHNVQRFEQTLLQSFSCYFSLETFMSMPFVFRPNIVIKDTWNWAVLGVWLMTSCVHSEAGEPLIMGPRSKWRSLEEQCISVFQLLGALARYSIYVVTCHTWNCSLNYSLPSLRLRESLINHNLMNSNNFKCVCNSGLKPSQYLHLSSVTLVP